ncbi:hypothetical protein GIB67_001219 [Kingdonia uniflora]|uniref:Elongation factor G-like domain-containing protein n=1 Tax=Kingdonia uniflora TaxID=39325 RepID=A0A7J7LG98_9MAGN|nr:hypothetical protein GIB67_001219 [Kingdonia uniflora]
MLPHQGRIGEFASNSIEDVRVAELEEYFLAFARIFSGVLYSGQKIYVLSALYDPLKEETQQRHLQEAEVQSLYLMMAQELKPISSAKAGNIVAIRGLGHHILKNATLSSTKNCCPFSRLTHLLNLVFLQRGNMSLQLRERKGNNKKSVVVRVESLESAVISGFQLATRTGPLCEEPMWGLAFHVEVYINQNASNSNDPDFSTLQACQSMTAVKEACRTAVLQKKPRLIEASLQLFMLMCQLQRASFGFVDELRRWTSGAFTVLLILDHWETLDEDPFFVPKTKEEIEKFGDGSIVLPNRAKKLINSVRRRKGLYVEEKLVQQGRSRGPGPEKSETCAKIFISSNFKCCFVLFKVQFSYMCKLVARHTFIR